MRLRHSLLASQVKMDPGEYQSAQYSYTPPSDPTQAVLDAKASSEIRADITAKELIDHFANGPRLLSAERMSHLYVVKRPDETTEIRTYDMILCYPHCVGDGIAIHTTGNLFFALLGGPAEPGGPARSDHQLLNLLEAEWTQRWGSVHLQHHTAIPPSAAERLPAPLTRFQDAAARIDFNASQDRFIVSFLFATLCSCDFSVYCFRVVTLSPVFAHQSAKWNSLILFLTGPKLKPSSPNANPKVSQSPMRCLLSATLRGSALCASLPLPRTQSQTRNHMPQKCCPR